MTQKIMAFLIIALLATYTINRIARLMRWIAPMAFEVLIILLAVIVVVWLLSRKDR